MGWDRNYGLILAQRAANLLEIIAVEQ